jgi:uncharacterized membrane protein YeaQ/YmgE (transglycosylase-associated protein family)
MIELIVWIAFGALIGWVASLIMGTDERQGGLANIIIGIVGAVIGGFIARILGTEGVTGFNVVSFLVSLGGAMLLIAIYKMFTRKNI